MKENVVTHHDFFIIQLNSEGMVTKMFDKGNISSTSGTESWIWILNLSNDFQSIADSNISKINILLFRLHKKISLELNLTQLFAN